MSPEIPNSHSKTPSVLNPHAPPFVNQPAPPHSTQLALLPLTKTPTDANSQIFLKQTSGAADSQTIFYYPAVLPSSNHMFFYHCYPSYSHIQPYLVPSPPFYTTNNYFRGLRPITICPQPSPPPLPMNRSMERVPEQKPVPATVRPSGVDRMIVGSRSRDERGVVDGQRRKRKKSKPVRFVRCWSHRQRSSRPPPTLTRYRKIGRNRTSAGEAGGTINESSGALVSGGGGGKTSLMIRNVPNNFMRDHLLRYLDNHCAGHNYAAARQLTPFSNASDYVPSEYDFFYLPMDFRSGANLGYAFVNFTTSIAASRFEASFQNYKWEGDQVVQAGRGKVCEIAAAAVQGKERLIAHFNGSRFCCRHDYYLPAYFSPPRDGFNASSPIVVGQRVA